ncbi:MAG: CHASE2 domain-containing protein [Candidatus Rifleibacteriota bacterium]
MLFSSENKRIPAIKLLVFFILVLVVIFFSAFFQRLDNWLIDAWFSFRLQSQLENPDGLSARLFPRSGDNSQIVLVLIDDNSILSIPGLFKGNRSVFAQALGNLVKANAKAIGLDVFFPSPDLDNPESDAELVEAVHTLGNVVVKAYRRDHRRMTPPFPQLARYSVYAPTFFTNSIDDAIRKVSLFFESENDQLLPSFQIEILKKFLNLSDDMVAYHENEVILMEGEKKHSFSISDGEYLQINYDRPLHSFKSVSFADLYNDTVPSETFSGKIVLIGFANSMTEEKYFTPIAAKVFSPYLHAMVLTNLLNRNSLFLTSNTVNMVTAVAFLILTHLFIFPFISTTLAVIVTSGITLFAVFSSLCLLSFYQIQVGIASTIFSVAGAMIFNIVSRYYIERSEKIKIKNAFQHYVTASVVNEILKNPEKLNLHGEERVLTIFFSDIEGFTSLSEGMSPLDVVSLLNEYLSEMTEIIFKYEGLLDKYEGDAIMAVFGAPVDQKDHAIRSCRCALENQKALIRLREKWKNEGKPQFKARIGINTGNVVVGNMGSKMRFDYTVIGDNVNLAARLETANKIMETEILVSETTACLAEEIIISRCLGKLKVAGKTKHVKVFEVLADRKSSDSKLIGRAEVLKKVYEKAYELFLQQSFSETRKLLEDHLKDFPDDRPAAKLLEKTKGFLVVSPPPNWEDIITQESK